MSRTTPFLPLPGLGGEWLNRLQYRVLKAERARMTSVPQHVVSSLPGMS